MRSPWTAKDDQPGPIGRRHMATGGDACQSALIRTPATTPSRWGPRKPGQSAPASTAEEIGPCSLAVLATRRPLEICAPGPDLATSACGFAAAIRCTAAFGASAGLLAG